MSHMMQKQTYCILHVLPDLKQGGGQHLLLRNLEGLDSQRFKSVVCYFEPHREMEQIYIDHGIRPHFFHHRNLFSSVSVLRRLIQLIRREQIDLIHIQGTPIDKLYGQIAAWWCGLPVVRTLHGPMPAKRRFSEVIRRPRVWLLNQVIRNRIQWVLDRIIDPVTVNHFMAVSDSVLNSWQPYLDTIKASPDKVTLNYNGVPLDRFSTISEEEREKLRKSLDLDGHYPVLSNVGTLCTRKGQQLLIPVMGQLVRQWPNARLLLIGQGPHREALEKLIDDAKLENHVILLGHRTDIAAILAVSDVFVFASYEEGFPLSVLEAMAAGKPVVAYYIDSLENMVTDGEHGYLVRQRHTDAMVSVLQQVVVDRQRVQTMGQAARQFVAEHYDMRATIRKLEQIYLTVLGSDSDRQHCESKQLAESRV